MQFTTYQPPEIYNESGELIRSGSWGPETPFYDGQGKGVYDYIANNLESLQNGVGGAAESASTATTQAALATAKLAEILSQASSITDMLEDAEDARDAALQAKTDAETALSQAQSIATPDGLAARVTALENGPHFAYNESGNLLFYYGREVG